MWWRVRQPFILFSGAPWVGKFCNLICIQEILVLRKSFARCTSVRTSPLHVSRDEILLFKHPRVSAVNHRNFCVRQDYFTKSCRQIWWRVNQPFILFIYTTSEIHSAMRHWFFFYTDLGQILQFFTILQDKLRHFEYSCMRCSCTTQDKRHSE